MTDFGNESRGDPQNLERLLIARQRVGDVAGMVALYEPDACLDCGGGNVKVGRAAIEQYFAEVKTAGRRWELGEQYPAIIVGDLALTSTRFPNGAVTAEVARKQSDGAWLWVIDKFSLGQLGASKHLLNRRYVPFWKD